MNYNELLNINYGLMNPFILHNIFLGLKTLRPTLRNYIVTKYVIKREKKNRRTIQNEHARRYCQWESGLFITDTCRTGTKRQYVKNTGKT